MSNLENNENLLDKLDEISYTKQDKENKPQLRLDENGNPIENLKKLLDWNDFESKYFQKNGVSFGSYNG